MRLAKSDYRWRRLLGHRLLRASGSPIVCRGLRSCQCRIGLSYLCLDQEGGGLSHVRGLRGCWRAVVGDTACEGGVHHRTATGLGWHEICHLDNGFDGMSKATNDNVLGRGPSRQSSNLRRWICDINFSAVFPLSPSLGMPSQLQQSRTLYHTRSPPSKHTPNRSQCTQRALPLLTCTQITSSGHEQQTLLPQ